jgi:hypothetical protein
MGEPRIDTETGTEEVGRLKGTWLIEFVLSLAERAACLA